MYKKVAWLFVLFFLVIIRHICAQNPFEISLTGIQADPLQKGIVALGDGGFVTKEVITPSTGNMYSILITRLDAYLGIRFAKQIPAFRYSIPYPTFLPATSKIIKANDNGFLVVYTDEDNMEDCVVLKLDSAGSRVWSTKIHTGNSYNNVTSLTCASVKGNGYAIAGIIDSFNYVKGKIATYGLTTFFVRLNEAGKLKWSKKYNAAFRQLSRILTFSDSSFMVLFPGDESQIMKIDSLGNVTWAKTDVDTYKGKQSDFDINDAVVDDNNFIYFNGNFNNAYPGLQKMNETGNQIWEREYQCVGFTSNNCLSMVLTKGKKIAMANIGRASSGSKSTFIETDSN